MARPRAGSRQRADAGTRSLDRRTFLSVLGLVVVVATVASLYLLVVSRVARQGRDIEIKNEMLDERRRENSHLEVEVARDSSAHALIRRAIDQGLDLPDIDQIVFVRDDEG